jgi:hypothetical protein
MSGTMITPQLKPTQQEAPHQEYGLLMSLALDSMLDADEEQALKLHLAACQPCSRQWQIWQTINRQFQFAPTVLPPVDFVQQVEVRLADREKGREIRVGLLLALLTLVIWAVGVAGIGLLLGFLIYNQLGTFSEMLHGLAYAWTMLRIVGESTGRALVGLSDNPSAIGVLLCYIVLAIASLVGWTQFLRRSIRPWDTQSL